MRKYLGRGDDTLAEDILKKDGLSLEKLNFLVKYIHTIYLYD